MIDRRFGLVAIGTISLAILGGALFIRSARPPAKTPSPAEPSPVRVVAVRGSSVEPAAPDPASTPDQPVPAATVPDREAADRIASLSAVSKEIAPLLAYSPRLKSMHDKLRAEGRDAAWAGRSETMLRDEYAQLAGLASSPSPLAITCGATLCEISGDLSREGGGINSAMMASIQQPELGAAMWDRGYHNMGEGFAAGASGRETFVAYYRREAPVKVKVGRLPAGTPTPGP